jgi:adenosylcobinamide-GDP ribazoletransferase
MIEMPDDSSSKPAEQNLHPDPGKDRPRVVVNNRPTAVQDDKEKVQGEVREIQATGAKIEEPPKSGPSVDDDTKPNPRCIGVKGALKGMMSFFTIFRLKIGEEEVHAMERNFGFVPIVGFIIGLIAAIAAFVMLYLSSEFSSPLYICFIAVISLASVFVMTKFLHFDGLTDFGDGMVVSGETSDHVRALKDPLIGSGGLGVALTVTLISVFGLAMAGSLGDTIGVGVIVALPAAVWLLEIFVKNAQVVAAAYGEPGNGMAAEQVRNTGYTSMIISLGLTVVLCAVVFIIQWIVGNATDQWETVFDEGKYLVIVMVVGIIMSFVTGWAMARTANKTFGFVNGDVLGATNEIARASILIVTILAILICIGVE